MKLRKIAKPLVNYQLGDGKSFSFWFDPWCHGLSIADLFPEINFKEPYIVRDDIVSELWTDEGWVIPARWNITMARILKFLNENYGVNISKQDCITWKMDK